MTDKELDNKLAAAFDNVRADSAVKARIRKGLTGDIMENRTIIVSKMVEKDEKTGKIRVNRRGRIAAAAIAGVLAVGGGAYLMKGGFDRVAPKTTLSSRADSDSLSSAHSDKKTDKMIFNGEEVDELPLTNEQMGFDPAAHGIYEKFGKMGAIYKLSNGNYLVSKLYEDETEDEFKDYYAIYDPTTNSIKSVLTDEKWTSFNIGENGIVFISENDDYTDDNIKTDLTCQVYDLDLVPLENSTMNLQFTDKMIREVMITPDNKVYTAVNEFNPDSENKDRLYIYDNEGNVIHTSKECDYINCCFMSKDGGFIYYGSENDQESATLTGVAISDAYIDCEHTDAICSDNKLHYPLYFDSGKYLYTVFYTDEGKQKIRRIDMTGKEELYFGEPEDVINYAGESDNDRYVTPDGKYLFVTNDEEYSDDNNPYYYKASVYDIDNGLKLVHEEKFYSVPLIRGSVLYDEDTGDVCIVASHSSYYDEIVTFNLFGKEFSNFGLKQSVKESVDTDTDNDDTNNETEIVQYTGDVTVPDFTGRKLTQAESDWKGKLNIKTEYIYNSEYEEGIIFGQDIAAGKTVNGGSTITLKVSKGKVMAAVPDVSECESEVAEGELRAAGFTVLLKTKYDDKVPEGVTIGTEPAAGEKAPFESMVTMYVSKGPKETSVKVPNAIGLNKDAAIALFKDNGLKPVVVDLPHDGDKNKVIDQSIDHETEVQKGDEVTLYVSTGNADPVDLTISLPLPVELHGQYTVDVYKAIDYDSSKTFNGESVSGSTVQLDISGIGTSTYTIKITNDQTGKAVTYATFDVDFEKKTAELIGSLNNHGLLATAKADNSEYSELTIRVPVPKELKGSYTADVSSDIQNFKQTFDGAAAAGYLNIGLKGSGTHTYSLTIINNETGKSVYYGAYDVDFTKKTCEVVLGPDTEGLLAINN